MIFFFLKNVNVTNFDNFLSSQFRSILLLNTFQFNYIANLKKEKTA